MSGIWKKLLLFLGVGVLILVGSSVGSAVVAQTGIVSALTPDSIEWRGFYSPHNPATLEGGFHLWPISIGREAPSRSPRVVPGFGTSAENREWQRQQEVDRLRRDIERQRVDDMWQQQELDRLRREFEQKRLEDQWQQEQQRQRDLYRGYP